MRWGTGQVRDAGNLLTRAALSIPAVDVDDVVVRYSHPARLIAHLRVRGGALPLRRVLRRPLPALNALRYRSPPQNFVSG